MTKPQHKICNRCKKSTPLSMMIRNKDNKTDGTGNICKECTYEKITSRLGHKEFIGLLNDLFLEYKESFAHHWFDFHANPGSTRVGIRLRDKRNGRVVSRAVIDQQGFEVNRISSIINAFTTDLRFGH